MSEKRLDRMERHMEQLIQMIGKTNQMVLENNEMILKTNQKLEETNQKLEETNQMALENNKMIKVLTEEVKCDREINEARHKELLKEIRNNSYEIDYLRNVVSKHDMEIHKLKASQSLS